MDSRSASWLPRTSMAGLADHEATALATKDSSRLPDRIDTHRLLELEHQPGTDRPDDVRGPSLLAHLDVVEIEVLDRVDVRDGPAAGHGGDPVGEQLLAGDEQTRRARAADQLVWGQHDGVEVGEVAFRRGAHVDADVRGGGGVVPERQGAVAVEHGGDGDDVAGDPGHVRRRREGPDPQRPVGVGGQLLLQHGEVDVAVGVLGDRDHLGDRLPPGQLVRSGARRDR